MTIDFFRTAKRIARSIIGRPILGKSILVYHRIAKTSFDPWNIAVSPHDFEHQLVELRKKTVLPLREFVRLHIEKKLPRNAVAITFDDGYACNALLAAPMLQSFGYPATFFVVSDAIARAEEFWWDQLEYLFHAPSFDNDTAIGLCKSRSVSCTGPARRFDGAQHDVFLRLWDLVRQLSSEERRHYLADLRGKMNLENETRSTYRPCTAAELRALSNNPLFEIGGHTVTHPSLPSLTLAEQEQEIVCGARVLESLVGKPIRSFSYPFGDWQEATRQAVIAAGFECAVASGHRIVRSGDNQFALPRWRV
jgi:peptidoglycan/xylan/chitin deacetylase (PgdA/CDA1 family)